MRLLVILNKAHKSTLAPLIKVWRAKGHLVRFTFYEGREVPAKAAICIAAAKADAVMMLVPGNRAASTLIDAPVLALKDRRIPVALVPVPDLVSLETFIATTCAIHERSGDSCGVALLAQRFPRYLKVTDKIYHELQSTGKAGIFKWTSDVIHSGDMLEGINQGAGICLYMGHGRSCGWVGYYGIRTQHITKFKRKPTAAVLSLCCWTAGRKNIRYSFCESLVMDGFTSSVFGAVRPTLFTDNTRWAINISQALQQGVSTIGELIVQAYPANEKAAEHYRLFGDPLTPLLADETFIAAAQKIRTYE